MASFLVWPVPHSTLKVPFPPPPSPLPTASTPRLPTASRPSNLVPQTPWTRVHSSRRQAFHSQRGYSCRPDRRCKLDHYHGYRRRCPSSTSHESRSNATRNSDKFLARVVIGTRGLSIPQRAREADALQEDRTDDAPVVELDDQHKCFFSLYVPRFQKFQCRGS